MAVAPVRVTAAFAGFNFEWLVGILGLIFAPWTVLMYVIVFPLNGFDWIWLGLGLAADIFSYVGAYHNRQNVPGVTGTRSVNNEVKHLIMCRWLDRIPPKHSQSTPSTD